MTHEIDPDETKTKLLELRPVVLAPMDDEVAGQVLDADGKPAAGMTVRSVPRHYPAKKRIPIPKGASHFTKSHVAW